jgi:hypothetical protein
MSITIAGLIVAALGRLAEFVGYNGFSVTVANLLVTVSTLAQIFGLLFAWIGRVRKGDITWYGKRILQSNVIDSLPDGQIR